MKKVLILPLFVMAALVSQAWGEYASCASELGNTYYCDWGTGCYEINKGQADNENCQTKFNECKDVGYLYTGVTNTGANNKCNGTWAEQGNDPSFNGGVKIWCKWDTSCQSLKNQTDLDNCISNGSVFSGVPDAGVGDGKTCTGGTWTGQGKNPNLTIIGCCKWDTETNCYPIMSNETNKVESCKSGANKYWNVTTCPTSCPSTPPTYGGTSSSSAGSNTQSSSGGGGNTQSSSGSGGGNTQSSSGGGGGNTQSSSSGGGGNPIISYNSAPAIGLNVTHFARSLQIASGKDATVSLFDIRGKQMFSQKVLSGTTTISLASQRQGIYYAVVRSGSQKQVVKIILK